jgi:Flp pilus assembly protein TadD
MPTAPTPSPRPVPTPNGADRARRRLAADPASLERRRAAAAAATPVARMKSRFPPASGTVELGCWATRARRRSTAGSSPSQRRAAEAAVRHRRSGRRAAPIGVVGLAVGLALAGCSTTSLTGDDGGRSARIAAPPAAWSAATQLQPVRVVSMADEMGAQALRDGRPEVAIEWFDKAIDANPDLVGPVNGKVVALARLGRFDEARTLAQRSMARGLQSPDLEANLQWLAARETSATVAAAAPSVSEVAARAGGSRDAAEAVALAVPMGSGAALEPPPAPAPSAAIPVRTASAEGARAMPAAHTDPMPRAPAAAAPTLRSVRLEVRNGTGVTGMARRTAQVLARQIEPAKSPRVRNHQTFAVEQTELRVRADSDARLQRTLAREVARALGVSVAIVRTADLAPGLDAQLIIGRDSTGTRVAARPSPTS